MCSSWLSWIETAALRDSCRAFSKNKGSPGVARMMVFSYMNQFLQICFLPSRWIAKGFAGHHPSNSRFTNVPFLLFYFVEMTMTTTITDDHDDDCNDDNDYNYHHDNDDVYDYHDNDEGLSDTPILAI